MLLDRDPRLDHLRYFFLLSMIRARVFLICLLLVVVLVLPVVGALGLFLVDWLVVTLPLFVELPLVVLV